MKKNLIIFMTLFFALTIFAGGCARQPTEKKSAGLIKSYFKKYGKKYPDTIYGKTKLTEVDVTGQNEIHKGLVAVESFITLSDGSVQRIQATLQRKPMGWRFVSWENATGL